MLQWCTERWEEITLFNSVGIALEDLAYAALAVDRARDAGLTTGATR